MSDQTKTSGPNIIEAIQLECTRCRELLVHYKELGAIGVFGALFIQRDIEAGEKAIASGDVVEMIAALKRLQGCA